MHGELVPGDKVTCSFLNRTCDVIWDGLTGCWLPRRIRVHPAFLGKHFYKLKSKELRGHDLARMTRVICERAFCGRFELLKGE